MANKEQEVKFVWVQKVEERFSLTETLLYIIGIVIIALIMRGGR